MSEDTTASSTDQQLDPIHYTCQRCGMPAVFQPVRYRPRRGVATGIAGMVYAARREAYCRGVCFSCRQGTIREFNDSRRW